MTDNEKKKAAKEFADYWADKATKSDKDSRFGCRFSVMFLRSSIPNSM